MNTNQAKHWQKNYAERIGEQRPIPTKPKPQVRESSWFHPSKGEKFLYVLFAMLVLVGAYVITSFSSSTDQINREIQTLESNVNQKIVTNDTLLFEVKELSKPERITKIAKENGLKIQDAQVKRAIKSND